jgi:hypothetical protein
MLSDTSFGNSSYTAPKGFGMRAVKGRPSVDAQSNIRSQTNLAGQLGGVGQNQFSLAAPAYEKGLGFYSNLLESAGAQRQALAPALRNIREGTTGAQSAIRSGMQRSGAKEMFTAEAGRVGQADKNQLLAQAPFMGAEGLSNLANQGLDRSLGAYSAASSALGQAGTMISREREIQEKRKEARRNRWFSIGRLAASVFLPGVLGPASAAVGSLFGGGGNNNLTQPSMSDLDPYYSGN